MIFVALKMLMGDRAKYIGIIIGLTFASLLITQQASVFVGLMTRTFAAITDLGQADIWVMDPKVQFVDDVKPLSDTKLFLVRGVAGVQWAVPLYKGLLKARLENGNFQTCNVLGLDDATLVGGPPKMVEGKLEDLHRAEAVIIDVNGARGKLARPPTVEGGERTPLRIGDTLELNDHRAVVVGLCEVTRTFQSQPTVYTTYSRATQFAPKERRLLSFILVKPKPDEDPAALCTRIQAQTGLLAITRPDFQWTTVKYYMKYTGIPINFGIAVLLGFLVGTVIAGQTFYNFTLDNLKQFGALKAMGASNLTLLRMILVQALTAGSIGYGLGVGLASLFGRAVRGSELAFRMMPQILWISAGAVAFICALSAVLSIRKVMKLEPAIVFKS
ncbi:MAG TPA: ABC transporter permease [Planctomycetota bacterium]|nr:ABC transporter permease [Planctomycetota bacterium]